MALQQAFTLVDDAGRQPLTTLPNTRNADGL
jgi:hypothetical protein